MFSHTCEKCGKSFESNHRIQKYCSYACTNAARKGISEVIATLLLIAIAVASAIIVYAFVTGLIGGLAAPVALVPVTGQLVVPGGTGTSTLVFTVQDSASFGITSISVANSTGVVLMSPWLVNGLVVSPANPLQVGAQTSASATFVKPLQAGTGYVYTVTVTFVGGGTKIVPVSVVGQL